MLWWGGRYIGAAQRPASPTPYLYTTGWRPFNRPLLRRQGAFLIRFRATEAWGVPPSYPGGVGGYVPRVLGAIFAETAAPPILSHKNNNRSPCPFFCSPALLHPSIPSAAWKLLLVLSYNHTCSSLFTYETSICTKCRRCNIFPTAAQQRPAPPRLSHFLNVTPGFQLARAPQLRFLPGLGIPISSPNKF